jgi:hypothetical protein
MTERAEGTFSVKLTPAAGGNAAAVGLGRMALDKEFRGDLGRLRALRRICI